jgi:hypothetical protein
MSYADEALRDLPIKRKRRTKNKKLNNMYTKENLIDFAKFVVDDSTYHPKDVDKIFNDWEAQAGMKFFVNGDKKNPILELKVNGDVMVKGNKVQNDIEVYDALKEFIQKAKQGVI